jgi:putative ABC transport system permease protein
MLKILLTKNKRDLGSMKVQWAAISLLVACGVGLFVSSWSAWQALVSARDHTYIHYGFADFFGNLKRAPESEIPRLRNLPGVEVFETQVAQVGQIHLNQPHAFAEPILGEFISLTENQRLNQLHLREGRLPRRATQLEAVLHESFAERNGIRPGEAIEFQIEGRRVQATVVGIAVSPDTIYALSPLTPLPDDRHFGVVWLHRDELAPLCGMEGAFNRWSAKLARGVDQALIREQLENALGRYGSINISPRSQQLSNRFVEDEIRQQRISALFFPAIFFLIGAFIIHIVTSRLVALHRAQIGTLKALGYSASEIGSHYSLWVVLTALPGIPLGVALGTFLGMVEAESYRHFFRFPSIDFRLTASSLMWGTLGGILPAVLGGWVAVRKAAALVPAEAMRPEVPTRNRRRRYQRRLRSISSSMKMIIRNLFHRPLRLILSILGLSTAVALLVMAGAWGDMIEHLIQTQFFQVQKENLTVSFVRPLPLSALLELSGFEGVLQVRGYRSVAARVVFQAPTHTQYRHEALVQGWPVHRRKPFLREFPRLEEGQVSRSERLLHSGGILLGRVFSERWGVKIGDRVWVEFLEGDRSTHDYRVVGFTDERMGWMATLSDEDLRHALSEPAVVNQALLRVDETQRLALSLKLRELPWVAGISFKNDWVQSFRGTVAAIVQVSISILTGFALVIAVAILGNQFRVHYSERLWELASLRVLGFSESEVFDQFSVEVLGQFFLALIPGCVLGHGLVHLSMKALHMESIGFPVVIFPSTYIRALLICLFLAFGGSVVIRRVIGKISLVQALKARD